jgi:hypothetical protein
MTDVDQYWLDRSAYINDQVRKASTQFVGETKEREEWRIRRFAALRFGEMRGEIGIDKTDT